MSEQKLCKNCVNFLTNENDTLATCDFEKFEENDIYKVILYIPELFECEEWEDINEL